MADRLRGEGTVSSRTRRASPPYRVVILRKHSPSIQTARGISISCVSQRISAIRRLEATPSPCHAVVSADPPGSAASSGDPSREKPERPVAHGEYHCQRRGPHEEVVAGTRSAEPEEPPGRNGSPSLNRPVRTFTRFACHCCRLRLLCSDYRLNGQKSIR